MNTVTAVAHEMEVSDGYALMGHLQRDWSKGGYVLGSVRKTLDSDRWQRLSDFTQAWLLYNFLLIAQQNWTKDATTVWEATSESVAHLRVFAEKMIASGNKKEHELASVVIPKLQSLTIYGGFGSFVHNTTPPTDLSGASLFFTRNLPYVLVGLPLWQSKEELSRAERMVGRRIGWLREPLIPFGLLDGPELFGWEFVRRAAGLLRRAKGMS